MIKSYETLVASAGEAEPTRFSPPGAVPAARAKGSTGLSVFETDVIAAVRRLDRAAAADVKRELAAQGRSVAYTTVAAALQRLHRRSILTRGREPHQGGERYVFGVNRDGPNVFEHLVERLEEAFGEAAYVRLFDAMGRPSPAEMERLRKKIEERRGRAT